MGLRALSLSVKWAGGVVVECGTTRIIFDPQVNNLFCSNIFITHAHSDHAKSFRYPNTVKFSTQETFDIVKVSGKREIYNWKPIQYHHKIKIDDIEIKAHNAGHILGSTQYEVISPEGNLVYTGDLNFIDTLTTKAADVVPCDILVLEATFGSPEFVFPPNELVYTDIIQWSLDSIKQGKIPALQADSLGNAQELTRIFNSFTTIPVITHSSVSRINKIYDAYGQTLNYLDAESKEASELQSSGEYVFIAPKNLKKLSENPDFNVAYVSGWAFRFKGKRKPFILSDHADFNQLINFVKESHPKLVLLCHGGKHNTVFGKHVNNKLGIEARPLRLIPTTMIFKHETQVTACEREILRAIRIPGFVYGRTWITNQISQNFHNFTTTEINEALDTLTKKGLLRIVHQDSYESR